MELINFSYSDIVLPLSLSIDSHTLIIGPSGSGKTTLLKAMLGTLKHSGTLAINGAQIKPKQVGVNRGVSMVWQDCRLLPDLTVRQNIELSGGSDYDELLKMFKIAHLVDRYAHEISGGEAQRVNIVRGISAPVKYILLDEPMQGIDPVIVRKLLKNIIHYLSKHNKIALMVTHEVYHAYGLFKNVLALKDGACKAYGDFESLYNNPNSPWLANFFGPYTVLGKEDLKYFDYHSNENPCMVRPEWFKIKNIIPKDLKPNACVTSVVWFGSSYKVNVSLLGTNKPLSIEVFTDLSVNTGDKVYVTFEKCSRPSWVVSRR
jgi:iron(III) transport system ATP-binding protein